MNRQIGLSLLTVVLIFGGLSAQARKGQGPHKMDRILNQLDLTDEQKNQITSMRQATQTEMTPLRTQYRNLRQKLRQKVGGEATDQELRQIHEQAKKVRQKMAELRFEDMLKMRKILSPEQLKKFFEMRGPRRGRGRTGGGGPKGAMGAGKGTNSEKGVKTTESAP